MGSARRFAEATGRLAKTDRVDAAMLARLGAVLEPALQTPKPPGLDALRDLQLARTALLRDRTAARNRAGQLRLPLLQRQSRLRLARIERDLRAIDAAVAALIAGDRELARRAAILRSIPGLSAVSAAAVLAEMPELGALEPGPPPASRASRRSPDGRGAGPAGPASAAAAPVFGGRSSCLP